MSPLLSLNARGLTESELAEKALDSGVSRPNLTARLLNRKANASRRVAAAAARDHQFDEKSPGSYAVSNESWRDEMAVKKTTKKASPKNDSSKKGKAAPAKVRTSSGALKMSEASPGFTVNVLEKSLAWYRDIVGFVVEERWEREGKLTGVQLRAGDVVFMLGQDDWKKGRDRKKGEGFRLYCTTTQDVDVLAEKIVTRGGKLDQEPRDQPWGTRDFALTDPDGFKITIARETKKR
jgi:uncharacterized glyoxalase superfamily protein PhnB